MFKEIMSMQAAKNKGIDTEKIKNIANSFYIIASLNNDIANSALVEAIFALKKYGYFKGYLKQCLNKSLEQWKIYENYIKFGDKTTYNKLLSISDEMTEEIRKDVDTLYYSFKNHLDKYNISQSDLLSKVQLASTLLERSTLYYDRFFKEVKATTGFDLEQHFKEMRLDGVVFWFEKAYSIICEQIPKTKTIDFNKSNCKIAYEILDKKLCDYNLLKSVCESGIANNNYDI